MEFDDKMFCVFVASVIFAILGFACFRSWIDHEETIAAMERGYSQVYDRSACKTLWVKYPDPLERNKNTLGLEMP